MCGYREEGKGVRFRRVELGQINSIGLELCGIRLQRAVIRGKCVWFDVHIYLQAGKFSAAARVALFSDNQGGRGR